jgi:hypothetical protein
MRWWIAALIFLATLINFVNRRTVSVPAPVITEQLQLTATPFASFTNWFLVAYTASQALSGRLQGRLSNQRGFWLSIAVRSVASMLHATVQRRPDRQRTGAARYRAAGGEFRLTLPLASFCQLPGKHPRDGRRPGPLPLIGTSLLSPWVEPFANYHLKRH